MRRNRFIARGADLERVSRLLADGRSLCVLGPGGVGKTRFLREVLDRTDEAFVFCDASAARSIEDLVELVIEALQDPGAVGPLESLLERRGPTWLVVDNVEQLLPAAEPVFERWLERAGTLQIILTSRIRPRVPSIIIHRLAPLASPDAAELFRERAAERGIDLVAEHDAGVGALMERLEGLPLAIELAAARAEVLGPEQLAERLGHSFEALRDVDGEHPPRHASLEATFRWSRALLDDTQARALEQVTVFRGPFRIEAAEAVLDLGASVSVLDVLQELISRSLLHSESEAGVVRLRTLASIRELASGGLTDTIEARHAVYFVGLAETLSRALDGEDGKEALTRLARARADLEAGFWFALRVGDRSLAARAVLAMHRLFFVRGPLDGGIRHLRAVLAAPSRLDPGLEARLWLALGNARRTTKDADSALADFERAEELARLAEDDGTRGRVLRARGLCHLLRGRFDDAREAYEEALLLLTSSEDRAGVGIVVGDLGTLAYVEHDLEESARRFREAVAIHHEVGSLRDAAVDGVGLAGALAEQRLFSEAEQAYLSVVELATKLGDVGSLGCAEGNLGVVSHELGALDEARARYETAVELLELLGTRIVAGVFRGYLAMIAFLEGDLDAALAGMARADRDTALATRSQAVMIRALHGAFLVATGEVTAGRALFEEARRVARERGEPHVARCLRLAGALAEVEREGRATPSVRCAHWEAVRTPGNADHRLCLQLLDAALSRRGLPTSYRRPSDALIVHPDGASFSVPGATEADAVRRLKRTSPAKRLLDVLAAERRWAPGRSVAKAELIERLWPGEKLIARSASNRLHVAISGLRKVGLGDLIIRDRVGYRLSEEVTVLFADPAAD